MRLHDPRPAAPTVHILFDGEPMDARSGETVAAALSAAGRLTLRQTPGGAPRGLHCGMGACYDCIVTIDGRPAQRACATPVADGMRIGSGPLRAPLVTRPDALLEQVLAPALLVVGGGPAGLSAAVAAAEAGADVLLLDERTKLGGQYYKTAAVPDRQARRGDRLRARAARVRTVHATVWGAFPGPEIAAVTAEARLLLRPRQLILATGAHEAPFHLPGWTLPGCMTTGALQGLVRTHRVSPGQRVVIAGNGLLNLQVAAELLRAGGNVAAVIEAAARPAGLDLALASPGLAWAGREMLTRLRRAGVPVLWGTRPLAVLGSDRVHGLAVAGPRGTAVIATDAVALNWGFQAETGLARALGAEHRVVAGGLETVTDAEGRTSLPGVFAVGDGARIGGAQVALHRGRAAGLAAARTLGLVAPPPPRAALRRAERFQRVLWATFAAPPPDPADLPDDVVVCRCEEVSAGAVRRAMEAGAASLVTLKRATRAGMGRCAGRFCGAALARLCGAANEAGFAAPRLPLRPVPAGAILADHPEPQDAVVPLPTPTRWATVAPGVPPGDAEVVVIGGGIIGLATALYLARDGADVLLVDRGEPGLAASTANAGSLHIQLVPYVYAAGSGGPMADALPLGPASVALWRDVARDGNEDLGLRTEGGLVLAETEAELVLLRSKAAFERSRGIPSEVIGPQELQRIAPALDGRFAGAAFCSSEGQGDPSRHDGPADAGAPRRGAPCAGAGCLRAGAERGGLAGADRRRHDPGRPSGQCRGRAGRAHRRPGRGTASNARAGAAGNRNGGCAPLALN